ncbi:hypothetical protein CHLRE_03g155550v5 [Chlamydomonas reinhardtii]|uniref:Uncharacterized protein n=1 Tax=Chlamydomonas reinhardtii TaxID=3055 RepID=A8J7K3_CHLRE|nr:uncharacterized protein CHLRE_03g155550v5 [Chlamydomonas reinhardtii]PNW84709.1 hypothetical protein CHLRE_03g155550v5 [Chlamydomonas reinhardtii]|eukprot:XP_001697459.1 DnaJ-like protein [Chlamydomonas reinhardtii]
MRSLVTQRAPAASCASSTLRHSARGRASCVAVQCSAHRCHYRVLGVSRTASGDEIKSAFRKLAKEKHPDVAGHTAAANEEFKAVKAAWDVLGNTESKAQYDGELRAAAAAQKRTTPAASATGSRAAQHRPSARSSPVDWGVPSKPPPPVPAGARHMRTPHEAAGPQFVSFVGVTQPQPPHATAGHTAHSSAAATTASSTSAPSAHASASSSSASTASARGSHSPPGSAGAWWAHWPPQQPNSQQPQQPHAQQQAAAATAHHGVRSRHAATKSRRVVRSFHPVDEGPAHPMPAGASRMRMDTEEESFVSFVGVHTHSHQTEQEWQPGHRDHVAQLAQQQMVMEQPRQQQQQQHHAPHHAQHRPHQEHHQH